MQRHGASNIPTTPTYDENVNDTFVVDIGDGCDGDQQLGASNDKPPDEDEDDDDGIAEFQATVLKRGSVAADRKRVCDFCIVFKDSPKGYYKHGIFN